MIADATIADATIGVPTTVPRASPATRTDSATVSGAATDAGFGRRGGDDGGMDPIDLDFVAQAMHSRDFEAYVAPDGSDVRIATDGDLDEEDAPEDWCRIPHASAAEEYEDIVAFIDATSDRDTQERLRSAATGTGAFRRFRHAVHDDPSEVGRFWSRFQDARQGIRAAEWLREAEIVDDGAFAALSAALNSSLREVTAQLSTIRDHELDLVLAREQELQTPECRKDRGRLERMLAPDMTEVGVSGREWSRSEIIKMLLEETADPILVSHGRAQRISDDVILVCWESEQGARRALRRSLWRRDSDGWRLVHHQGTPLG